MKLNRLTVSNIRSYKSQELVFPDGAVLLSGDVGSGKTTLLLAIEYALFGLQPGHRGSSLLRNGENEGRVTLECTINGHNVTIERTLKRSSKGVNQEDCWITLDGARESLSVTEIKSRILNLLNYPEEFIKKTNLLYRYTVYSPQEEMKQIILEPSESRLDVLRHIFGIDKYRRIKENCALVGIRLREKIKILQQEIKEIENYKSKITNNESMAENVDKRIQELEKRILERKKARQLIEDEAKKIEGQIQKLRVFEKELEKTNIQLKSKQSQLDEYSSEEKRLISDLSSIPQNFDEELYKSIVSKINMEKSERDNCQKSLSEINVKISSIKRGVNEDLEKRKRVFNISICPTCLQDVSETHKHNILNATETRISEVNKEAEALEAQASKLRLQIDYSRNKIEELENKKLDLDRQKVKIETLSSAKNRVEDLKKIKISVNKDIDFLIEHLSTLKSSILEYSKFSSLARAAESEIKLAMSNERSSEIEHAESKKEREFLNREKLRLKEELSEKEKKKEHSVYLAQLESWLSESFSDLISNIERKVMLRVRDEFSRLFNKWFGLLTTESFQVKLDENFTPIIIQSDYELDYSFLSGGERTAVALAYRLALNQILNTLHSSLQTKGLIILDEPTDGFSEQQLDKIRDILKEIRVEQLLIVSHEPKIEGFVDNVIKINKESGSSKCD